MSTDYQWTMALPNRSAPATNAAHGGHRDEHPSLTGIPSATEVHDDLRARGADYTPSNVARECIRAVLSRMSLWCDAVDTLDVLDVCAGAGCWSKALRGLWASPPEWLRITAVELDLRDRPHLERHADRVIIGDWTEALGQRYHLAIGNPDFQLLRAPAEGERLGDIPAPWARALVAERGPNSRLTRADMLDPRKVGDAWYDVGRSMPAQLLEHCDAVALLHRQQAWSKDGPGVAVRRVYPPAYAWDIPGSLRFRAPGSRNPDTGKAYGADQHNYTVSLWLPGHTGPTQTALLRDFSPAERRWAVRPGTE